ncbi:MAG: hypothetical protein AAF533_10780 [Acidobacteriota bacterium]
MSDDYEQRAQEAGRWDQLRRQEREERESQRYRHEPAATRTAGYARQPQPSRADRWNQRVNRYEGQKNLFGLGSVGHGRGKVWYRDGRYYEGQLSRGDRHGQGYFESADKTVVYEGAWKNDKTHGKGTMLIHGDRYEGTFKNGWMHGNFSVSCADGGVYRGHYRNGEKNGTGAYVNPDGSSYCGSYRNGRRHGKGEERNSQDRLTFKGEWCDGVRHGTGVDYSSGMAVKGIWKNGEFKRKAWF